MKTFQMALVGLMILHSTAHAESGRHKTANAASQMGRNQYSADRSSTPNALGRIVKSGNECAPDIAEAAWGPGSVLVGYTCHTITN
jgi:hypothetical protein